MRGRIKNKRIKVNKNRGKRREREVGEKKAKRFLISLIILIFLLIGISRSSYFHLHTIKIKGCEHLTEDLILNRSKLKPKDSIIWLRKNKIKEFITSHPRIKRIKIHRLLPQSLLIEVIERKPKLQILSHSHFLILDEEQVVIDKMKNKVRGLPELKGLKIRDVPLGEVINKEEISYAKILIENETYISPKTIKQIIYDDAGRLYFYTNDHLKVKLGWPQELPEKMWQLSKVLKTLKNNPKKPSYIDMQVKERPAIGEGEI